MFYYSAGNYYKERFGEKIYRLSLPGGKTCPNRDGRIGSRGCIFCSAGGSGEFAPSPGLSYPEQLEFAKRLVRDKAGRRFTAYFQSFTSTYGDIDEMYRRFSFFAEQEEIAALSIATRPDCLPPEVMELLIRINKIKPVYIELGLQSVHASTSEYIRRGYDTAVYDDAVERLKNAGLPVIAHVILGLPFETKEQMYETVSHVAKSRIHGIKLQLLHVIAGTDLEKDYLSGKFSVLGMEEYIGILGHCVELLPEDMVIYRLTGDGDKRSLVAPLWSGNKKAVLGAVNRYFRDNDITQGRKFL